MLERHLDAQRRAMLAAGTIAAAVYNANPFRTEGSKAISPLDFVPDYKRPRGQVKGQTSERETMTVEQQKAFLTSFFGCGPGKPN